LEFEGEDPSSSSSVGVGLLPDFVISENPSYGFGLWPPDPWEALLHDTLAPPFNEPGMSLSVSVDMGWNGGSNPLTPRILESAERGTEGGVSLGLVTRLGMAFPVSIQSVKKAAIQYHISYQLPYA